MEEYATPGDFETTEAKGGLKYRFESFLDGPYFVVSIIILVAISAFSMGRFWSMDNGREPVKIVDDSGKIVENTNLTTVSNSKPNIKTQTQSATVVNANANIVVGDNTEVVASKNGTKYHLPTCPGAKQISDANKITFSSISSARSAGYTPALNCKGLK